MTIELLPILLAVFLMMDYVRDCKKGKEVFNPTFAIFGCFFTVFLPCVVLVLIILGMLLDDD
jgi:hypothetical protein